MSRPQFDSAVVADVAPVRAEPSDDAEQVTQALRGEPLAVDERRDAWARIRTFYDYPGWIRQDALGPAPGPDPWTWPLERVEGDPLDEARSYLGAPYLWGGMTERGIDCSGLVHMAYRRLGQVVPRDADEQQEAGRRVDDTELRAGDLITYGDSSADHIAFWLGEGRILHSTGRDDLGVVEEPEPEPLRERRRRLIRL
jgi:hypothetical protein